MFFNHTSSGGKMVVIEKKGDEIPKVTCDKDEKVIFFAKTADGYMLITAPANSLLSDIGEDGLIAYVFKKYELTGEFHITEGCYCKENKRYFLRHEKNEEKNSLPELYFSWRKEAEGNGYSCSASKVIEVYRDEIIEK